MYSDIYSSVRETYKQISDFQDEGGGDGDTWGENIYGMKKTFLQILTFMEFLVFDINMGLTV